MVDENSFTAGGEQLDFLRLWVLVRFETRAYPTSCAMPKPETLMFGASGFDTGFGGSFLGVPRTWSWPSTRHSVNDRFRTERG